MESVPYVSATFNGHTAQFLLDTGAGGVDVIFHRRAVEEFELLRSTHSATYAELTGIDASGKNLEVLQTQELSSYQLQDHWLLLI